VVVTVDVLELPETIETARLNLRTLTIAEAQAITSGRRLAGWHDEFPRDDDVDAASLVVAKGLASSWGPRQIMTIAGGVVVGGIGFLGAPVVIDGVPEAEVGYGLVPSARNAGLASEALESIVSAAERISVRVRATVAADNAASRRVLDKCGFTLVSATDNGLLLLRTASPS